MFYGLSQWLSVAIVDEYSYVFWYRFNFSLYERGVVDDLYYVTCQDYYVSREDYYDSHEKYHVSNEDYLVLFRDFCCVDAFWSKSVTYDAKSNVIQCLSLIWEVISKNVDQVRRFYLTEYDSSPIYRWCSEVRSPYIQRWLYPIFTLLLMPQNRNSLHRCITFSNDPNEAVSHFLIVLKNLEGSSSFIFEYEYDSTSLNYFCGGLMDLFVTPVAEPDGLALFTVLHNSSVLVQLGKFLIDESNKYLKLDRSNIRKLHEIMISKAHSEQNPELRQKLEEVARDFGRGFGLALQPQLNIENQRTETTNHDSEERGWQPQELNENENENSTVAYSIG